MATRNRNIGSILEILRNKKRFSVVNSGRIKLTDAIHSSSNRSGPYQRDNLILNTAQKLEELLGIVKSWNSSLLQVLNKQNKLDDNVSRLLNPEKGSEDVSALITLDLIIYGGIIPVAATIGIIMNIVGMYVLLSSPRRKQVFSLLLLTLLVFNTIFLGFQVVANIERFVSPLSPRYRTLFHMVMNSAIRCSGIASIFMLLAICHLKLCAIRKPFDYANNMLSWKEKRNIWGKYFLPVIMLSILLTLPALVEFEFPTEEDHKMESIIRPSSTRLHPLYSVFYVGVLNIGILGLLPIAYLTYMACQIRIELKRNDTTRVYFGARPSKRRRGIAGSCRNGVEDGRDYQNTTSLRINQKDTRPARSETEIKGLRAMIRGILVFVVLHAFRITTTFGQLYIILDPNKDDEALKNGYGIPGWLELSGSFSELCMVINSSLDGFIYMDEDLRTKFRNSFRKNRNNLGRFFKKQDSDTTLVTNDALMVDVEEDKAFQDDEGSSLGVRNRRLNVTGASNGAMLIDIEEKEEVYEEADRHYLGAQPQLFNVTNDNMWVDMEETEDVFEKRNVQHRGMNQHLEASLSLNPIISPSYGLRAFEFIEIGQRRTSSVAEDTHKKST